MADEDVKALTEAQHIQAMLEGEGWRIVHARLVAKIMDLQNIYNIDSDKSDSVLMQLLGRRLATELLTAWLKQDVFGAVEQQAASQLKPAQDDQNYVDRGN